MVHGLGDDGEARFRTLAEAIPQIVWTALPDSGVDYCNRRWYEVTGMSEEQTLGFGWSGGLHPDDRPVALQNWEEVLRTGEPFEMEYRLKTAARRFSLAPGARNPHAGFLGSHRQVVRGLRGH